MADNGAPAASLRLAYTGQMQHHADYRGRLAPSPTGLLHLGHVRTFAVAHARARAAGGQLLLRIDDLDPQRSRAAFLESAKQDLRWLGFEWNGEPWRQSLRGASYRTAWERLVAGGFVYPCRCSRRDLAQSVSAPHEQGAGLEDEPIYPGTCRPAWMPASLPRAGSLLGAASLPATPAGSHDRAQWLAAGPNGANWRFRVPLDEPVHWPDGGLGRQTFTAGRHFGDFAVWRRDGVPTYQLATTVDDAAMQITEVVRGADLLLSTARQLLLYRTLGLSAPDWFHCPLVVDEAGNRLAKRADALSVRSLREQGLSPAAVLAMAQAARLQ